MTQAERIIEKFGGPEVVAEVLGITVPRVKRWTDADDRYATQGLVPAKHYKALLEAANARGIELAPSDFFGGSA